MPRRDKNMVLWIIINKVVKTFSHDVCQSSDYWRTSKPVADKATGHARNKM